MPANTGQKPGIPQVVTCKSCRPEGKKCCTQAGTWVKAVARERPAKCLLFGMRLPRLLGWALGPRNPTKKRRLWGRQSCLRTRFQRVQPPVRRPAFSTLRHFPPAPYIVAVNQILLSALWNHNVRTPNQVRLQYHAVASPMVPSRPARRLCNGISPESQWRLSVPTLLTLPVAHVQSKLALISFPLTEADQNA